MKRKVFIGMGTGCRCALSLSVWLWAAPLVAQTAPEGLRLTTADPPRSDSGAAYQASVPAGVSTEAVYATRIEGGRLTPESRPRQAPAMRTPTAPVIDGNLAMLLVVGGLALGLFLWLRYGGGALLARTPAAETAPQVTPEGWHPPQTDAPGTDLLSRAAAMADRRAALVLLLRACLLQAARSTSTRLARSDTERRVLDRLPQGFALRPRLAELLHRTELAHYGGRAVSDDDFARGLDAARAVLGGAHA